MQKALKTTKSILKPTLLLSLLLALYSATTVAQNITGVWITENGESKIEIYESNGTLWGKIIWVKEQTEKNLKNVGKVILENFVRQPDNAYKGTIHAPHLNKTFKGIITPKSKDEIVVRGYLGFSLLGGSQRWQRAH